jgi:xanthine dehydrogenase accessory factor
VLRALRDRRIAGRHAVLVTVVRTWGSSPRPPGSIMAMAQGGQVVGSVSGGWIEDDLLFRCAQAWSARRYDALAPPPRVHCGVSAYEAHRFGLPCGGTVELLLEHDPGATLLGDLVARLEAGELVRRVLSLGDGACDWQRPSHPKNCTWTKRPWSTPLAPNTARC